jgi:hypothetical protein
MSRNLFANLLATIVVALAVTAPIASANPSTRPASVPGWLSKIQYPGTSSEPTVYVHTGEAAPPAVPNGYATIPAWLARIQYPGTSSEPTVVVETSQGTQSTGGFDWVSAVIGAGAALGIALAGAGTLMVLRKRRTLVAV